jgi:stage V sporulation protein G
MQITEVRVFPVGEDKLKAYASIVLDECFIINDLKVIQGKRGLFISMPSRRRKRGGYRDVAHPLNNETRQMIEDRILEEYQVSLESGAGAAAPEEALLEDPPREEEGRQDLAVVGPPLAAAASNAGGAPQEPAEGAPIAEEGEERSLEEIEELHLRDSFWSVS